MELKTNIEAEKYVKNILKIPSVDFTDIDISVLIEFITALEKMLDQYPKTINLICSIGNSSFIIKELELMKKDIFLDIRAKEKIDDVINGIINDNNINTMTLIHLKFDEKRPYIALCFNSYLRNCDLEHLINNIKTIQKKSTIAKCNNAKVIIYHEFGHFLDFLFHLSWEPEFFKIMMEKGENPEAFYYIADEMFAWTFGEYYATSKPEKFCEKTITFVHEKYSVASSQKEKIM
ncbi:MAG: hypothetical protein PHE54_04700 [Bacilli bacterium]|nr:hypothetical protein [Bacilli bacterium]